MNIGMAHISVVWEADVKGVSVFVPWRWKPLVYLLRHNGAWLKSGI